MSLVGYGSPTVSGANPGFGSATGSASGYGDPSSALALTPVVAGRDTFSDYGGEVCTLTGDFGSGGPFYVRLLDTSGGVHPSTGFAWSGVPGNGPACYPWQVGDTLQFIVPAVEPGVYQVRVYFDPEGATFTDSPNQVEIKRRVYAATTYRWRGQFPGKWLGPGPRRVRDEPWL